MTNVAAACEIAVFGAGAAGSAAAIAAARAGARVCLFESGREPGGTVAHCLIHTLGGLYDSAGELLHDGLVSELIELLAREDPAVRRRQMGRTWVLNVCPNVYRRVLCRWLVAEAGVTLVSQAHIAELKPRQREIYEIRVVCPGSEYRLRPHVVIDATGTAEVIRRVDISFLQGTQPIAAGGLMLRLRGVDPSALKFPNSVAVVRSLRAAAHEGHLPHECGNAWLDSGVYEDEAYLKLFVPLPMDWKVRQRAILHAARHAGEAVLALLKRRAEFKKARIEQVGTLGVREGGRIRGEYCLTMDDVRQGRKFDDAACRCAWPIEFWDPVNGVSLEYLPPGSCYEIPFRCFKVDGLENVWAVGKCLSADPHAHASARVAGCCWAMGQAVGQLVGQGVTV